MRGQRASTGRSNRLTGLTERSSRLPEIGHRFNPGRRLHFYFGFRISGLSKSEISIYAS